MKTEWMKTALGFVLVLAAIGLVNYLSFRHYKRFDWTSEHSLTLSRRSKDVVRHLQEDVNVYLVMSEREANYGEVHELLRRYEHEGIRMHLHVVEPERNAASYRLLSERLGFASQQGQGEIGSNVAIALETQNKRHRIAHDDLMTFDFEGYAENGREAVDVRAEQAISGGLLQVTQGRSPTLCVSQGHGEWALNRSPERDLSMLAEELMRENIVLENHAWSNLQECDAILVVAPTRAFSEAEAAVFRDYLRAGGNALLLLDAEIDRDHLVTTGLEETLHEFAIRLGQNIVIEPDVAHWVVGQSTSVGPFSVANYGDHVSMRSFKSYPVPFFVALARSVSPIDPSRVDVLMTAGDTSYAEADVARLVAEGQPERSETDLRGPVPLGIATRIEALGERGMRQGNRRGGRLVVLGDADFLAPALLGSHETANFPVISALVEWVLERDTLIDIPPRRQTIHAFRASPTDLTEIALRTILVIPFASILMGIGVFMRRRTTS